MDSKIDNIIEIKDLCVEFKTLYGNVIAVNNATINFKKGFINGIIGESGSGKSTIAYSIVNLLPKNGKIIAGTIKFNNEEINNLTDKQLENIRGNKICFIPQNPMSSLSPYFKIENQITEVIEKRNKFKNIISSKNEIKNEIIDLLKSVHINEPEKVIKKYPHELSGGMLQRIIISMALIVKPDLLIADEPTTALDVTVQLQILELIKSIQKENKMSVIFITHDLGVIAKICDYVSVMYAGNIVEVAKKNDIFNSPKHEYTKNLIKSMPKFNNSEFVPIKGNPISLSSDTQIIGCPFAPRCDSCMEICLEKNIKKTKISDEHETSCFKYLFECYNEKLITEEYFENAINNTIVIKKINCSDVIDSYLKYKKVYLEWKKNKNDINLFNEYKKLYSIYKNNDKELKDLNEKEKNFYEEKKFLFEVNIKKNIQEIKKKLNKIDKKFFDNKKELFDYLSNINIRNESPIFDDFSKEITKKDVLIIKNEYQSIKKEVIKSFFKFNSNEKTINNYKFSEIKKKYFKILYNYKINKKIFEETLKLQKYIINLALLKKQINKKTQTIKAKKAYDDFIKQEKKFKIIENDFNSTPKIIKNELIKLKQLYIDYLYEYYG